MKQKPKPKGPPRRRPIPCPPRSELEPGVRRFIQWEVEERARQDVNLHEMERRSKLRRQMCRKMERQWDQRAECKLGSISLDTALRIAHSLGWELRDIILAPLLWLGHLAQGPLPE